MPVAAGSHHHERTGGTNLHHFRLATNLASEREPADREMGTRQRIRSSHKERQTEDFLSYVWRQLAALPTQTEDKQERREGRKRIDTCAAAARSEFVVDCATVMRFHEIET